MHLCLKYPMSVSHLSVGSFSSSECLLVAAVELVRGRSGMLCVSTDLRYRCKRLFFSNRTVVFSTMFCD
jgi:hypothetical protein